MEMSSGFAAFRWTNEIAKSTDIQILILFIFDIISGIIDFKELLILDRKLRNSIRHKNRNKLHVALPS